MTPQTLRYGLTTALRPITVPQVWDGIEAIATIGCKDGTLDVRQTNTLLGSQHDGQAQSLRIPASTRGDVRIERVITGAVARHCTITVEAGANVTIIEHITGSGTLALATTLRLEPGARVVYHALQDMSDVGTALLSYEAELADANLHWLLCCLGASFTQASVTTRAAEGANVKTHAVIVGAGTQQFDLHASTIHTGPHSRSDMLTRGILDGRSRAIAHGLITIDAAAADCDSYQKSELLLLSDAAGADAIPNLEIHNHDVRCSHGATIGRLDAEKLFYLTSRGIPETEAKRLITEGFVTSIVPEEWLTRIRTKLGYDDIAEHV